MRVWSIADDILNVSMMSGVCKTSFLPLAISFASSSILEDSQSAIFEHHGESALVTLCGGGRRERRSHYVWRPYSPLADCL